jgi:HK97 family phage prohead protease
MSVQTEARSAKEDSSGEGARDASRHGPEVRAERTPREPALTVELPHGLYVRSLHVRAVREVEREVDAVASTEAVDSYGEIVRANWDLDRYLDNPVILWAHNRLEDRLPVGRAKNVRVEDGQLLMTVVFDAVTEFDEQVFQKYVSGTLKGFSVGFNPRSIRVEKLNGEEVVVLDDNELFEVSCVPIPSNPEALAKARIRALEEARVRAAEANRVAASSAASAPPSPLPEAPLAEPSRPTPGPRRPEMKEGKIKKTGELSCSVECPHCTEDFEMSVEVLPVPPKKAAELAEEKSLRAAAETRVKALEAREAELVERLVAARAELATLEVDALLGTKLFPAERDTQLELARMYLGQKEGEAKWKSHLDAIRTRPDLKLVGGAVVGKDTTPPATAEPERGTKSTPAGSRFAVRVAKDASRDA